MVATVYQKGKQKHTLALPFGPRHHSVEQIVLAKKSALRMLQILEDLWVVV